VTVTIKVRFSQLTRAVANL